MMKKVVSMILSGALVLGGCFTVFAQEGTEAQSEAGKAAEGSLEELGGILDSLGVDGSSLDSLMNSIGGEGEGLDSLLNSLGGEDVDLNGLLGGLGLDKLMGSVMGEDGSVDLNGILQGLGLGDLSSLDLSSLDLSSLGEMFSDPEALKEMASGLFGKDGLGTLILDMIASEGGALESVVKSLKGDDGAYDVNKIVESLENAEQKENSIVINGTELGEEEIKKAAEDVSDMFTAIEAMESESEAA